MKRMHLHVSVDNLAQSIVFYNNLFGANPTIEKPDYAKWMLDDPLVNFAISKRGAKIGIDHIGIQVDNDDELYALKNRLEAAEMSIFSQEGTACCYSKSNKHWVQDPSGIAWETYHSMENIPTFNESVSHETASACCAPAPQTIQFGKRPQTNKGSWR